MEKDDLMIHRFEIADCDGGGFCYAVCNGTDTSPRSEIERFDTMDEAQNFINNFK